MPRNKLDRSRFKIQPRSYANYTTRKPQAVTDVFSRPRPKPKNNPNQRMLGDSIRSANNKTPLPRLFNKPTQQTAISPLQVVQLSQGGSASLGFSGASLVIPKTRKNGFFQRFMYIFGILVLIFSLGVSVQTFSNNNRARQAVEVLGQNNQDQPAMTTDEDGVQEGTATNPAEKPVHKKALYNYKPQNPADPRYIRIPSLKVFSRVKTMGVDKKTGSVDSPRNIHDTGWYSGSDRPDSKSGLTFVVGHVSGWTSPGVFKKIKSLKNGAEIEIETGKGKKVTYKVSKVETKKVQDIDMADVLYNPESDQGWLRLMTCGGQFNAQTKKYDSRVIVLAKAV